MTQLNNSCNAPFPLSPIQGGTGVDAPTAHGILIAEGVSPANPIVLGAGQVLIGTTAGDPVATTITGSAGVIVTSTSGAINISGGGSGFTWNDVAGGTTTLVPENAYTANSAGLTTFALPGAAAFGDTYKVVYKGTGGWKVTIGGGQNITLGDVVAGTSLQSTAVGDCITISCTTANTGFIVTESMGNITYI